jgi:hypothetical protein
VYVAWVVVIFRDRLVCSQLATNEAVMFVLGQHITRLNNLKFTSYERSMYRKRATLKWLPNVSFSRLMPAFAGWLLATRHKYALHSIFVYRTGSFEASVIG